MQALQRTLLSAAVLTAGLMHATCAQGSVRSVTADERAIHNSTTFMYFHPDIAERRHGIKALEDGFPVAAMSHFKRAARYADKGSQAVIGEL